MCWITFKPPLPYNPVDVQILEQRASGYKTEKVVQFLQRIGLGQYSRVFQDNEITGEDIIVPEGADELLSELGVKSALDKLKISVLFKRELRGAPQK